MKRYNIRRFIQGIYAYIRHAHFHQFFIFVEIKSNYSTSKTVHNTTKDLPDFPRSHDPNSLAVKVKPYKTVQRKSLFPYAVIGFMRFAIQGEQHCHSVFSNRFWRISRNPTNGNAKFPCSIDIHVIKASTAQSHYFNTPFGQDLQNLTVYPVIHKNAHRIYVVYSLYNMRT